MEIKDGKREKESVEIEDERNGRKNLWSIDGRKKGRESVKIEDGRNGRAREEICGNRRWEKQMRILWK